MHSFTEENYLKAIYKLEEQTGDNVINSDLAKALSIHSATVTDMLKKMSQKKLIIYEKSKGFKLTGKGKKIAVSIIRKHRLWEVFLVNNLGFGWDEVHDMAEQLEHIQSEDLINRLDTYLGFPKADPHGDPIPNINGEFEKSKAVPLSTLFAGKQGKVSAVTDHSTAFLSYLTKIGIALGDRVKVKSIEEYDNSYTLLLKNKKEIAVSSKFVDSILVIVI
ncbi:MAG: metal-dependent transcriptional regulator [Daejeonella sp.]